MKIRTAMFSINLAVEYNPDVETQEQAIDRRIRDFENDDEIRYMDSGDVEVYDEDEWDNGYVWENLSTQYERRFTCEIEVEGGFKYKAEIVQDTAVSTDDNWVFIKIYPSDEEGFEECPIFTGKCYSIGDAEAELEEKLDMLKNGEDINE